jgi:hypothetical protein
MAGESVGTVHVDQLLSDLAISYRPDLNGFIADLVCPYIPVTHESDIYPVFNQGDFYATDVDDLVPDRPSRASIEFSHTTARTSAAPRARVGHLGPRAEERRRPAPPRDEQAERRASAGCC